LATANKQKIKKMTNVQRIIISPFDHFGWWVAPYILFRGANKQACCHVVIILFICPFVIWSVLCKHVDVVSRLLPELGSGDRLLPTAELNAK
jgi:hypothetical protein